MSGPRVALGIAWLMLPSCGLAYRVDTNAGSLDAFSTDAISESGAADARFEDASTAPDGPVLDARAPADASTGNEWRVEVIDDVHEALHTALVSSEGQLHVVYYDSDLGDLLYSRQTTPGHWEAPITIDQAGSVGWNPSLAVDSMGTLHVAYQHFTSAHIAYAFLPRGGTWSTPEIAVDSEG